VTKIQPVIAGAELEPGRPLGPTGRAFWDSAVQGYRVENPAAVELLLLAAEGLDRKSALEARLASGDPDPKLTQNITATVALVASLLVKLDKFVTPIGAKETPVRRPGRPPRQNLWWEGVA
jgi:hypothetical protein